MRLPPLTRRTLSLSLAALASACAPSLSTFNTLAPKDDARLALRDGAYGAGPRQKLDVYAPEGGAASAPVIVFFYGGSWDSGDKADYEFVGRAFAARGFVTVLPNYRVAPDVFPSFIEDGAAAVRWVADNIAAHGGDPSRIVIAGHSAGAYIAAMLGLDGRYLTDAGVSFDAIAGVAGLSGPYDFLPFDVDSTRNAFGGAPDPAQTQPVNFASADAPPFFLAWGDDDDLVGRRNIDNLSRALRQAGGRVDAKIYPGVDHIEIMLALSRPLRGRAPSLEDVAAFAARVTA